jgi:glycine oxidase
VVIGRGIVGLAVAFALMRSGRKVTVIGPRDRPGSATTAAVGLSSLKGLVLAKKPLFAAKMAAHEALPRWLREVEAAAGVPIVHSTAGVFEPFADLKAFDGIRERVFHREFTGCLRVNVVPREGLQTAIPLLARSRGAFHYVRDLWLEPVSCLAALELALRRNGAVFLDPPVDRLRPTGDGRGVMVEGSGLSLKGRDVVVAAGVFSDGILMGSGLSLPPQELVEGETARAEMGSATGLMGFSALMRSGKTNMVIHQGRAWAGSTDRAKVSLDTCQLDAVAVALLAEKLADATAFSAFLPPVWGVRGRYRDRAPAIGPLFFPGCGRPVWVALGFYKSGIQLAHLFAQKLAMHIAGAPLFAADGPFWTSRFKAFPSA